MIHRQESPYEFDHATKQGILKQDMIASFHPSAHSSQWPLLFDWTPLFQLQRLPFGNQSRELKSFEVLFETWARLTAS